MNCIILISSPGAGKGTVSQYIKDNYNIDHISTGNLLRKKSETSKEIKDVLDKGLFVDDNTLINVLEERLKKQKNDFILDGTPRKLSQLSLLEDLFKKYNINIKRVIFIDINFMIALKRIMKRKVCENCNIVYNTNINRCPKCNNILVRRSDDKIFLYIKRYLLFKKTIHKIINHYKDKLSVIYNNKDLNYLYKEIDNLIKGDD